MADAPKILAFAGSTRKGSFNKRLVQLAAQHAEAHGGRATVIDLADYSLPVFDEDLESEKGRPESAARLVNLFLEHDALIVASPEYNSSITAVLKNTIDWVSRPVPGQPPLAPFRGKVAALMSASPGNLGGLRGLVHARAILGNIGVLVLPDQVAVSGAHEAFGEDGKLKRDETAKRLDGLMKSLVETTRKLKS